MMQQQQQQQSNDHVMAVIQITGMKCKNCVAKVTQALLSLMPSTTTTTTQAPASHDDDKSNNNDHCVSSESAPYSHSYYSYRVSLEDKCVYLYRNNNSNSSSSSSNSSDDDQQSLIEKTIELIHAASPNFQATFNGDGSSRSDGTGNTLNTSRDNVHFNNNYNSNNNNSNNNNNNNNNKNSDDSSVVLSMNDETTARGHVDEQEYDNDNDDDENDDMDDEDSPMIHPLNSSGVNMMKTSPRLLSDRISSVFRFILPSNQPKYVQLDQFDYDSQQHDEKQDRILVGESSFINDSIQIDDGDDHQVAVVVGGTNKKPLKNSSNGGGRRRQLELSIGGMNCSSCVAKIESHLKSIQGVESDGVSINLLSASGKVSYHSTRSVNAKFLKASVEQLGFSCRVVRNVSLESSNSSVVVGKEVAQCDSVQDLELGISGMNCVSCSSKIENTLKVKSGISSVSVNLMTNSASVRYDSSVIGKRDIIQSINSLGFRASLKQSAVTDDLNAFYDSEILIWRNRFIFSLILTIPVFFITMFGGMHPSFGPDGGSVMTMPRTFPFKAIVVLLFSTPIHFVFGLHFHQSAFKALKAGYADMSVLISMGTNAAYLFSAFMLLRQLFSSSFVASRLFFETAAMIIMFQNLGKFLEMYAKKRTSAAITELARLQAKSAIIVKPDKNGQFSMDSEEHEIDIELVQKGDYLKVLPGERVPADGVVTQGVSSVDESMITGEYEPVVKHEGDKVIGGTLNNDGSFIIRVDKTGAESMLSQIVNLVKDAQCSKAPIQQFADKISQVFVPCVIGISLLTFFVWYSFSLLHVVPKSWIPNGSNSFIYALEYAMAVLVIACPCALGLATPTAVMVSTGVGAKLGILIKGGEPLEVAHNISAVVFDKTGTITEGRPSVVHHQVFDGYSEEEFLVFVQAAEGSSEHPLGKSLVQYCKQSLVQSDRLSQLEQNIVVQEVHSVTAEGMRCTVVDNERTRTIFVGKRDLLQKGGVLIDEINMAQHLNDIESQAEQGRTVVLVGVDTKLVGFFALSDTVKKEAQDVVRTLHNMGIKTVLISGDRRQSAQHAASKVGIKRVISEVLPAQKLEEIKRLQHRGHVVAMVGDGINDSPSLAQANVGIAIGAGSDIAIQSADVVLVKNDLRDVVTAIDLSKYTYDRIRLNHVWACGYNVLFIPIASGAIYPFTSIVIPPYLAAGFMIGSSLLVMVSSLMLRVYKKKTLSDVQRKLSRAPTRTRNIELQGIEC